MGLKITSLLAVTLMSGWVVGAVAENLDEYPHRDTPEASIYRGDLVYHNYCQLCHGPNAEGNGRAAKMYNPKPSNLRNSTRSLSYMREIIIKGGKAMKRSEFMPPWGEELTAEQQDDLMNYLKSIDDKS